MISDAYEKEFGYKTKDSKIAIQDWVQHLHPEDKIAIWTEYLRMLDSNEMEWQYRYRFLKADGSVSNVSSTGIILRDANGKVYRMIGSMQDTSKQKVLEARLEQEIALKEVQIFQAMNDAKETERSEIGRELHDNVNQLLGASRLYLDLAKQGGPDSELYLSRSSEYTLTAIEEIRKLTKSLTTASMEGLGLREAIEQIVHDSMEVNPAKISCVLTTFNEDNFGDKFKLTIFRIVQEQLNNISKHAKASRVIITLSQNKKAVILIIFDNGVGVDTHQSKDGIGLANIKKRAALYSGITDIVSQPGNGFVLTVVFPFKEASVKEN
jgi:signal transduction histidine kinase